MPAARPALEVQASPGIYPPLRLEAVAMGLLSRAWLSHLVGCAPPPNLPLLPPSQTCTRKVAQ